MTKGEKWDGRGRGRKIEISVGAAQTRQKQRKKERQIETDRDKQQRAARKIKGIDTGRGGGRERGEEERNGQRRGIYFSFEKANYLVFSLHSAGENCEPFDLPTQRLKEEGLSLGKRAHVKSVRRSSTR